MSVVIEIDGRKIDRIEADAPDILAINDDLISSIKRSRAAELKDVSLEADEKQRLYNSDEIQTKIGSQEEGDILHFNEGDLLQTISEMPDVRNKKQLQYLAGQKHNPQERVRFTLKPYFGFLFFIVGEKENHLCWELLNSHATYLWSFDKTENPMKQIKEVGECIHLIWEIGREKFKRAYRRNALEGNYRFYAINHKSGKDEGFSDWKRRLDGKLG